MVGRFFLMLLASFLCLVCANSLTYAQGDCTGRQEMVTTPAGTRFLEHLPCNYNTVASHPVLVFLHGLGEVGPNINAVKKHGPPQLIDKGRWGDRPFIVISPQLSSGSYWPPALIDEVIEHVKANYKVDEQRIYLTGLSLGGIGTFNYAARYPEKLAAVVPIAGCSNSYNHCRMKDVPTWAFHGENDGVIGPGCSQGAVREINSCTPSPRIPAKLTLYPGVGHNSWTRTYDLSAGHDIYSWFLSHRLDGQTPNNPPIVDAGPDKAVILPNSTTTINGEAEDTDGEIVSFKWNLKSGPKAPVMSGTETSTLSLRELSEGEYVFELEVVDDAAAKNSDQVKIDVIRGTNPGEKIILTPAMVHNESGLGDPTTLVDEQNIAGDPLGGAGGAPKTHWFTGWSMKDHPASAYIDLGASYDLSTVCFRDIENDGPLQIEYGEPGNWTLLFTDDLRRYNQWAIQNVSVTTRYIRVTKLSNAAYTSEIVLYGELVNQRPPVAGKIGLTPSMIHNESGLGDPSTLVDEQNIAGDPLNNAGGTPGTYWFTGWSMDNHPASSYIDLGEEYELTAICFRDVANDGPLQLAYGEPGNWTSLFTDNLKRYNEWAVRNVNVTTRYVRITKLSNASYTSEIVLYGQPGGQTSPPVEGKLNLTPSMVHNEFSIGDPSALVDEQSIAGDPLNSAGGAPTTSWFTGWKNTNHPASAYIDLGALHRLTAISLRDVENDGKLEIAYGEPGNWTSLLTDDLRGYNRWTNRHVDISTRYLRITKFSTAAYVSEIVLYGYSEQGSPAARQANAGAEVENTDGSLWANQNNTLRVYPNPVVDDLNIALTDVDQGIEFIRISSLAGREVYYQDSFVQDLYNDPVRIDALRNLEDGIYLVQVGLDNSSLVTRKIFKK